MKSTFKSHVKFTICCRIVFAESLYEQKGGVLGYVTALVIFTYTTKKLEPTVWIELQCVYLFSSLKHSHIIIVYIF